MLILKTTTRTTAGQEAIGTMKPSEQRGKRVRSAHHHRIMTEEQERGHRFYHALW